MLSNFKRRAGVLTAVAVLAALVPVMASSPVSAAPAYPTPVSAATIDSPAAYLACPASANIPSAGFTDTTDADVDCLAYYGIVKGTTATTYSPDDSVSRWAMALYITRTLSKAGTTLGSGVDQGFTDISGLSAEIQTAVNQIKQLGITTGKTATTYAPMDNVSRQEMALFIERTLDNITAGPGGSAEAPVGGVADGSINSNCGGSAVCTGVYNYTDIDAGSVTVEASIAIKELFALGIHDGVSATTFNPTADMTRAAMADFMGAAINHSNIRPEGLHMQSTSYAANGTQSNSLHVSYRDASHLPIVGSPVDVFRWANSTTEGNAAFLANGNCDDSVATGASLTKCYIDVSEPKTDTSGNMIPTANATAPVATIYPGTDSYYAWTSAAATTYDNDLHGSGNTFSTINVTANPAASEARCTHDAPAMAQTATAATVVKFGSTVTITCQVTNGTGATSGNVPAAGVVINMNQSRVFTTDSLGAQDGLTILTNNVAGVTDATGSVSWTVSIPADPNPFGTDRMVDSISITGTAINNAAICAIGVACAANISGHMVDDGGNDSLTFSLNVLDTTAAAYLTTSTQTADNGLVAATPAITRSNTATVWDQYGDPVAGNVVTFSSTAHVAAGGAICDAAAASSCTFLAAHNLVVGEQLMVVSAGAWVGATATQTDANSPLCVATIESATVVNFKVANAGDVPGTSCAGAAVDANGGAASTAASPAIFGQAEWTAVTRTTGSTGQATYSFVDTGNDDTNAAVTATGAGTTAAPTSFYRYNAAGTFAETDAGNNNVAANTDVMACFAVLNAASDYAIAEIRTYGANAAQFASEYRKLSWDSGDQFAKDAGAAVADVTGAPVTMAAWETEAATINATGCVAGDLANWTVGAAGISTDTNVFRTGTSV
jgi:hypothetical protein